MGLSNTIKSAFLGAFILVMPLIGFACDNKNGLENKVKPNAVSVEVIDKEKEEKIEFFKKFAEDYNIWKNFNEISEFFSELNRQPKPKEENESLSSYISFIMPELEKEFNNPHMFDGVNKALLTSKEAEKEECQLIRQRDGYCLDSKYELSLSTFEEAINKAAEKYNIRIMLQVFPGYKDILNTSLGEDNLYPWLDVAKIIETKEENRKYIY